MKAITEKVTHEDYVQYPHKCMKVHTNRRNEDMSRYNCTSCAPVDIKVVSHLLLNQSNTHNLQAYT